MPKDEVTKCPYCQQEIGSKDFSLKDPDGNYWHFPCADMAIAEWKAMKDKLSKINDLATAYMEEGPFTTQKAFDRVSDIYNLSLRLEGKE